MLKVYYICITSYTDAMRKCFKVTSTFFTFLHTQLHRLLDSYSKISIYTSTDFKTIALKTKVTIITIFFNKKLYK